MKILLLTTHIDIGGVGFYILNLAKGLKKRGIDCFVASAGGGLYKYFQDSGIPIQLFNMRTKFEFSPKLLPVISRLAKFVSENKIDIIHAHTRVSQVIGQIVSSITKTHFVTTCHGFFKAGRISRKLFPCLGERIIAISSAVRNHLIWDFNVKEENISLIYNGINFEACSKILTDEEKIRLKTDLGINRNRIIGAIGRLSPVKGYKYLLTAFNELKKEFSDLKLLIIGEGFYGKKLKKLSSGFSLEKDIIFLESKIELWKYLSIMDIFAYPSVQEGLGLSLIEAMANGRPCVASSIGGITDVINHGENGLLVPPNDSHSLSESVRKLLSDKSLRIKLGSAAKDTVREKFSLDKMVEETVVFYEDTINDRRRTKDDGRGTMDEG